MSFQKIKNKIRLNNNIKNEDENQNIVKKFHPWNMNNIYIPESKVISVLKKFGIKMHEHSLFQKACVHVSYRKRSKEEISKDKLAELEPRPENCMDLWDDDNERIEFVGDALLSASLSQYLYIRYPNQSEGFLTNLRMKLACNRTLGTLIKKMGLNKYLIISKHFEEKCNGRNNLKILGGMMESWIAAVYYDALNHNKNGWDAVCKFVVGIFEEYCDFAEMIALDYNYKAQLLTYYQMVYGKPPKYTEIDTTGPVHDRIFTMGVLSADEKDVIATASAKNKKMATQLASKKALIKLGVSTIEN
jgi:ribonuclease-3